MQFKCLILTTCLLLITMSVQSRDVVVLAGGFGSCPWAASPSEMSLWGPLKQHLVDRDNSLPLDEARSTQVIRVCYSLSNVAVAFDVVEHTRRWNPGNSRSLVITSEFKKVYEATGSLRMLAAHLTKQLATNGSRRVTLIGQSLGGDLMMELVGALNHDLIDLEEMDFTLVTIDPISKQHCGPLDFIGGLIGSAPGCREFPRKSEAVLQAIQQSANHWLHFYQDDFPWLHSGPTPHAHESIRLNYRGSKTLHPMGAHALTEMDSRVWDAVAALL